MRSGRHRLSETPRAVAVARNGEHQLLPMGALVTGPDIADTPLAATSNAGAKPRAAIAN